MSSAPNKGVVRELIDGGLHVPRYGATVRLCRQTVTHRSNRAPTNCFQQCPVRQKTFARHHLGLQPRRKLAVVRAWTAAVDIFEMLASSHHSQRGPGSSSHRRRQFSSLVLSQRLLGTREIILVHHADCGLQRLVGDTLNRGGNRHSPWLGVRRVQGSLPERAHPTAPGQTIHPVQAEHPWFRVSRDRRSRRDDALDRGTTTKLLRARALSTSSSEWSGSSRRLDEGRETPRRRSSRSTGADGAAGAQCQPLGIDLDRERTRRLGRVKRRVTLVPALRHER